MDNYLEDFFFAGCASSKNCEILMSSFQLLCEQLRIPFAEDNTIGPTTQITFLGLKIDTKPMLVKIPITQIKKITFNIHWLKMNVAKGFGITYRFNGILLKGDCVSVSLQS